MSLQTALPSCDQVDAALVRCGIGIDAPELHGLVAGFLAAGGALDGSHWLDRLHVDADAGQVQNDATLQALRRATVEALDDSELGFQLLLPEESAPLPERIGALFDWCRGFLAGFALVSGRTPLSEDAQEAFADLAKIASFVVDEDDQDENALMEISEFVRVAVLLIHGDRLQAAGPTGERLH